MKNERIAIIMNEQGARESLLSADKIQIFEKHGTAWQQCEGRYVNLSDIFKLAIRRLEIRIFIRKLNAG